MKETESARTEFEKKPWVYKAAVRLWQTIAYYGWLVAITIRKTFDRKYREEMSQAVSGMEEKTIKAIADLLTEDKRDGNQ